MAKNKKDRSGKKHIPRDRSALKVRFEPWRVKLVFDPIETIIAQLEGEGTLTTTGNGIPMFLDAPTGDWHDTAAALRGLIDTFEIMERRRNVDARLDALRTFAERIENGDEIDQRDTDAVRASLNHIRPLVMDMTIGEVDQLVRDYQTKEEIEKRQPVES